MYAKPAPDHQQSRFFSLAKVIDWQVLEESFGKLHHPSFGRPCKPIRLMTGLLIPKQLRNYRGPKEVGGTRLQVPCKFRDSASGYSISH